MIYDYGKYIVGGSWIGALWFLYTTINNVLSNQTKSAGIALLSLAILILCYKINRIGYGFKALNSIMASHTVMWFAVKILSWFEITDVDVVLKIAIIIIISVFLTWAQIQCLQFTILETPNVPFCFYIDYASFFSKFKKKKRFNKHMNTVSSMSAYTPKMEQKTSGTVYFENRNVNKEKNFQEKRIKEDKNAMDELESLIGLKNVKQDIRELQAVVKTNRYREKYGMKTTKQESYHLVFLGNPGTGKTTVARIIGSIYSELGILEKGHVVEVDRSQLVAEHVGGTAVKTKEKIKEAYGGILFIDEAYTLSSGGTRDFGKECINTLLTEMENNRDKFVVIVAGYPKEMNAFMGSNPGLKSRFSKTLYFEDYSEDELYKIFDRLMRKNELTITNSASIKVREVIRKIYLNKRDNFGNARVVRQLYDSIVRKMDVRIANVIERNERKLTEAERKELLKTILDADVDN